MDKILTAEEVPPIEETLKNHYAYNRRAEILKKHIGDKAYYTIDDHNALDDAMIEIEQSYASQTVVDGDWEKGFEETILDEAEERYDNDNENIVFRHGCNFALNYIKTNLLSKVSVGGMFGLEDVKEALRIGVNIGMSNVQEPRFEGDYNFNQDNALLQCDEYIKSVTPLSSLGSEVQSK